MKSKPAANRGNRSPAQGRPHLGGKVRVKPIHCRAGLVVSPKIGLRVHQRSLSWPNLVGAVRSFGRLPYTGRPSSSPPQGSAAFFNSGPRCYAAENSVLTSVPQGVFGDGDEDAARLLEPKILCIAEVRERRRGGPGRHRRGPRAGDERGGERLRSASLADEYATAVRKGARHGLLRSRSAFRTTLPPSVPRSSHLRPKGLSRWPW